MDVLAYNSLNKDNIPLRTTSTGLTSCINTLNSNCTTYLNCVNTNGPASINGKLVRCELWSYIPAGSGWTTGFKVCDTSGFFRCGACCAWTVPAGVTCARFQLWGAGSSSGAAGCCGGAPFGGSGAYASVIMPVTAGWAYTLCAGCAFCCYGSWNTQSNSNGCASFITGCNLTNFCAMGGIGNICTQLLDRNVYYFVTGTVDSIPACTTLAYLGYCLCATGSSFCSTAISTPYSHGGTLCCTSGFASEPHSMLQMYHSSATVYGTAVGGTVYGINGAYSEFCANPHCMCGYMKHPPIYGFGSSSQCSFAFTASTGGGNYCSASSSFGAVTPSLQIPGAGGFAMQTNGGCVSVCGDAGRMGMVCVSYK
jgi:hypothetical protein